MVRILGVSGWAGMGKDTLADHLVVKYGYVKLSFASYLKEVAFKYFAWDGIKDKKGVELLISLGKAGRAYDKDIWLKPVERKIQDLVKAGQENFVIADVRFLNEVDWVKSLEGKVVRTFCKGKPLDDNRKNDISENELNDYSFDHAIFHIYQDIPGYYTIIDKMMEELDYGFTL